MIWHLFSQTGNIETYLLLKQLENEQLEEKDVESEDIASFQTKM
ncbi:MAG TPA: YqzL family protein [Pseudogracilibacillus sp.]|nr:YqzL family protein [Pseudogracilibacillus sp.]